MKKVERNINVFSNINIKIETSEFPLEVRLLFIIICALVLSVILAKVDINVLAFFSEIHLS